MARFSDEDVRRAIRAPFEFREVDFPGLDGVRVAVRCLSEREIERCRIGAVSDVAKLAKSRNMSPSELGDTDPMLQERLVHKHIIASAFFDADTVATENPIPFFSSPREVDELSSTQSMDLLSIYNQHHELSNPQVGMTDEEVREFVDSIKKEGETPVVLRNLERDTLLSLCTSLVAALAER